MNLDHDSIDSIKPTNTKQWINPVQSNF
jgi:hypothetical protein